MKTGTDVRRRTLPPLPPLIVAALLLAGLPGAAAAAPAGPAQGGSVMVERVWEWVRGWGAEVLGLQPVPGAATGEEGGGIDPDGQRRAAGPLPRGNSGNPTH